MDIKKVDRIALKSYFVKNAVPTAGNFADLIDGMINQKEDGIAKLAGEPLRVQADGDDASQKKAINFYKDFSDPEPVWTLSLNPRTDPAKPDTARPGFSVSDAKGNSRLFVDENTGNVGVGTANPRAKLHIAGGGLRLEPEKEIYFADNGQVRSLDNNHRILFRRSENIMELREYGDVVFSPGATSGNATAKVTLKGNGNVGIGTASPAQRLHVVGGNGVVNNVFLGDVGHGQTWAGFSHSAAPTKSSYGFLHHSSGQYALINKKSGGGYIALRIDNKNKMVIDDNGSVGIGTGSPGSKLHVVGPVMEQLDIIRCKNRGDWSAANHPIMVYFKSKLRGKPKGTYLKAIQDHPSWRGHYWQGWVDAAGAIRVVHNHYNTPHVAR